MAAGYLIDTNVISELRRRLPEPQMVTWFAERPLGTSPWATIGPWRNAALACGTGCQCLR